MGNLVLNGATSGATTLQPTDATTQTITLPANSGTVITTASTFAGTGPAFSAKPASEGQSISINVNTKITMDSEVYDTANCYNTSTSRFTPNVAGYYQINGYIRAGASASTTQTDAAIYKNGSIFQSSNIAGTGANDSGTPVSAFVYMNGSTDYLEVYFQYNSGNSPIAVSTISNLGGSGTATWWYGYLVRAA